MKRSCLLAVYFSTFGALAAYAQPPQPAANAPPERGEAVGAVGNQDAPSRYDRLMVSVNPDEAAEVLADEAYLYRLRAAEPEKATRLIQHLTVFTGLKQMISQNTDAYALRYAWEGKAGVYSRELAASGLDLGPKLSDWVQRYMPPPSFQRWRHAMGEWDTLSGKQQAWIAQNGVNSEIWKSLPYDDRRGYLTAFANNLANQYLSRGRSTEKTAMSQADWDEDSAALRFLSKERYGDFVLRIRSLNTLHQALERAKGLNLQEADRRLLDAARDESMPLEDRLAALSQAFDRAKQGMPELRILLPAGERLPPDKTRVLEAMLKTAYIKEVGAIAPFFKDFYAKTPYKVYVRDLEVGKAIMQYLPQEDAIAVDRKTMDDWLKGHGWKERDLLERPEALERFVLITAPTMGHEMLHQFNGHWEMDHLRMPESLPFFSHVQEDELASLALEARINIELSNRSERFRNYVKEEFAWSGYARSSHMLATAMWKNPREFRSEALSQIFLYAAFPTIDDAISDYAAMLKNTAKNEQTDKYLMDLIAVRPEMQQHYNGQIDYYLGPYLKRQEREAVPAPR